MNLHCNIEKIRAIYQEQPNKTWSYHGLGDGYWIERYALGLYDPEANRMILVCPLPKNRENSARKWREWLTPTSADMHLHFNLENDPIRISCSHSNLYH